MSAKLYDLETFRAALAKRKQTKEIAAAVIDVIDRAGFDIVPKSQPLTPAERGRLGGLTKARRCRGDGHDHGRCPTCTGRRS